MKKILFTFLILFTALILCSFSAVFDDSNVTTNVTTNTAANTTTNIYTPVIKDYISDHIDSFKEYKKLCAKGYFPDDFVYYNQISIIGDYEYLNIPHIGDYDAYYYNLIDNEKVDFILYIYNYDKEGDELPEITEIKSTDMRTHPGVERGVYYSGEIKYIIYKERLSCISWTSKGKFYYLYGPDLSEYPDTTATFIGKMLNLDTAHEALEELRSLPKDEVKWYENISIIAGISVAVVCIGGICGYVVYKKRKTKSLSDEPGEE